ncbi:MAG: YggS family pyridoxal phosphate enzyme, partial [Burkholderiales bacterium]
MAMIGDNLQAVISRIAAAVAGAGRAPGSVRLLAASKTHSPARIAEAEAAGQRAFGENYVQEAIEKMDALANLLGE